MSSAFLNSAAARFRSDSLCLPFHRHEVHQAHRRSAREQQLLALIVQVLRGLLDLADVADAEADRGLLAGRDHHFLAIRLVAFAHALELVQAATAGSGSTSGLPFDMRPISLPSR